jgi:hypothetical protein
MTSREYSHVNSLAATWYSILALAHKWELERIAKAAFEKFIALPGVEAMEKIIVCENYGFKRSIISSAFWAVCSRGYPLTYKEGEKIGWEACILIAAVRDRNAGYSEQLLQSKIAEFEIYRK